MTNGESAVSVGIKMNLNCNFISKVKMSVYQSQAEKRQTTTSSGDGNLFSAMLTDLVVYFSFPRWLLLVRGHTHTTSRKVLQDSSKNSLYDHKMKQASLQ